MLTKISLQDKKEFQRWIIIKEHLHGIKTAPFIHEGEIWWAALGENIGVEINGKSKKFSRPVVIIKKFNRYSFLAIPLTSQTHNGTWWAKVEFLGRQQYACLTQVRSMSTSRLYSKMGRLSVKDLAAIKQAFFKLLS